MAKQLIEKRGFRIILLNLATSSAAINRFRNEFPEKVESRKRDPCPFERHLCSEHELSALAAADWCSNLIFPSVLPGGGRSFLADDFADDI